MLFVTLPLIFRAARRGKNILCVELKLVLQNTWGYNSREQSVTTVYECVKVLGMGRTSSDVLFASLASVPFYEVHVIRIQNLMTLDVFLRRLNVNIREATNCPKT